MAVLAGLLVAGALQAQHPGRSTDIDTSAAPGTTGAVGAAPISGTLARGGALVEPLLSLAGAEVQATHLWDKVMAIPTTKALGLVASDQTFPVEVWNTYRRTQWSLTAAAVTGVGGLQLSGVTLPDQLSPLGSAIFTATVPEDGSATIANVATFSVAQDRVGGSVQFSPSLTVTGMRITPFPFDPDWTRGPRERIEYRTDIISARTGAEQRIKLRMKPRRSLSFSVSNLSNDEAEQFESLIWRRSGDLFGVPWWPDGVRYTGTLSVGGSTIAIDTTNRLFSLAPMVMVWVDSTHFEIQTISSVSGSLITCTPLAAAYTNPFILPVFPGRLPDEVGIDMATSSISQADLRFACEVGINDPRPTPAVPTQAYGFDVLEVTPDWDGPKTSVKRLLQRFDSGSGPVIVRDRGGVSFQGQPFRWFLSTRAEIQAFRDFMDRRVGSLVPFWVATWREDLTLAQAATNVSTGIVVKWAGYTSRMFPDRARRYLAIRTAGGWIYRKVTSSSETATTETLTLDAATGVALAAGTMVSFLTLARMKDDDAEIEWSNVGLAQATTEFVELPKEVPA